MRCGKMSESVSQLQNVEMRMLDVIRAYYDRPMEFELPYFGHSGLFRVAAASEVP